ncbi:MAG: hypothetical protein ABL974_00265 [Prosthecobacter sp.]
MAAPHLSAQTTEPVVLSRKVVDAADHKIIFERIAPPVAAIAKTPLVVNAANSSAGTGGNTGPKRRAWKAIALSCTVYNHEFTELRWYDAAGAEFVAWSSIDFSPFMGRSVGGFDQDAVHFELFLGLSHVGLAAAGPLAAFHALTPPAGTASWYVVRSAPESVPADAFAGLDALHRHYDAHKAEIIADHEQVKAANAAREAYDKAHPPVKQDTLIRFWPVRSAVHDTSAATTKTTSKEGAQ